jgi:GNAT superfamily N-acetyltransferase
MEFRKLQGKDAEQYRTLRLFSLQESPFAFSESFEDECQHGTGYFRQQLKMISERAGSFVLGAFTPENELTGFVTFTRDARSKAKHKGFLQAMYIKPGYRKTGLGSDLLQAMEEEILPLNGLEQIHLWVLVSETNAVSFYEKAGFICQGPVVKQDLKLNNQYVDAMYMVKYLVHPPGLKSG